MYYLGNLSNWWFSTPNLKTTSTSTPKAPSSPQTKQQTTTQVATVALKPPAPPVAKEPPAQPSVHVSHSLLELDKILSDVENEAKQAAAAVDKLRGNVIPLTKSRSVASIEYSAESIQESRRIIEEEKAKREAEASIGEEFKKLQASASPLTPVGSTKLSEQPEEKSQPPAPPTPPKPILPPSPKPASLPIPPPSTPLPPPPAPTPPPPPQPISPPSLKPAYLPIPPPLSTPPPPPPAPTPPPPPPATPAPAVPEPTPAPNPNPSGADQETPSATRNYKWLRAGIGLTLIGVILIGTVFAALLCPPAIPVIGFVAVSYGSLASTSALAAYATVVAVSALGVANFGGAILSYIKFANSKV